MTPEERQLLTSLADRLKATPGQQRDPEAEQMIRQLVQDRPDAPYLMAQTVIMQDFALRNAQAQITDLQRQLEAASQAQPRQGSFLGGLFGGAQQPAAQPGPWGTRAAPPPQYATPPQYAPQPGGYYGGPVMEPSQTSGFLRSAAQTAVGVAGGALLFEGIQSLFSGHQGFGGPGFGGGFGGGFGPTESLSETTIVNNNYYDDASSGQQSVDDRAGQDGNTQDAAWDPSSDDTADFDDGSGGSDDLV
jgi:hypothetical protein